MKPVTIESTTCGRSGHCFLSRPVEQTIFREGTMPSGLCSKYRAGSWKASNRLIADRNFRFPNAIARARDCRAAHRGARLKPRSLRRLRKHLASAS
jgi:hypothetical protein